MRDMSKKRSPNRNRAFTNHINSFTRRNTLIEQAKTGDTTAILRCKKDYGLTIIT